MKKLNHFASFLAVAGILLLGSFDTLDAQTPTIMHNGPLAFSAQQGGFSPSAQSLQISSSGAAFTYNISFAPTGSWLNVNPLSGTTGTGVTVTANPSGLAAATYNGTITVTSPGSSITPAVVQVTFSVTPGSTVGVSPSSMSFTYNVGGSFPTSQVLAVTAQTPTGFTASATSLNNWLTLGGTSGVTPANIQVSVNPTGLAVGNYEGQINVTPSGGTPVTINVNLTVSGSAALTVTPASLSFYFQVGGSNPPTQNVSIGSSTGVSQAFNVAWNVPWLVVSPVSSATPASLSVTANPSGLAQGTYNAQITVTPFGSGGAIVIPVTFIVSTNPLLQLSTSALTFNGQFGGSNPPNQSVSLSSTGAAITNLSATPTSTGNWLSAGLAQSTTPATLNVGVAIGGLAAGTHTGQISINGVGAGNTPLIINVTLDVSGAPMLSVTPTALSFAFQTGGALPGQQVVEVKSTGAPITYSALAQSTPAWLSVTPSNGVSPGNLIVSANPTGLAAGTHSGAIVVTPVQSGVGPIVIPVTLYVSATPLLVVSPIAMTFTVQVGSTTSDTRQVAISSTGAALNLSVTTTVNSGGTSWLLASTATTTPSTIFVTVNPTGLSAGTYTGTVIVSSSGPGTAPANSPQNISVTLIVQPAALL
ncbi:MAG: beta strand repeat-containing protein, partial [Bryobacteraceae bacterium]